MKKLLWMALLAALATLAWWYMAGKDAKGGAQKAGARGPVTVSTVAINTRDVPVRLTSQATLMASQSVDVRAQIAATVSAVHVKEGQSVRAGERLFSLDVRSEAAGLAKAEAQLAKSRADLANAERVLRRQQELSAQKFIAPTALDAAQTQADSLRAQVAGDEATVQSARVALSRGEIVAPIAGRTGTVVAYPGTLVQPTGNALVSIARIDPIEASFTLPERDLAVVKAALARSPVPVRLRLERETEASGTLAFIDNTVDATSGTIRLKARFANTEGRLWPGMFANAELAAQVLVNALVVPAQAVQTGPEQRFVFVVGTSGEVSVVPVTLRLIQDGEAVIEGAGLSAGTKVVLEGGQNLRAGSKVIEASPSPAPGPQLPPSASNSSGCAKDDAGCRQRVVDAGKTAPAAAQ